MCCLKFEQDHYEATRKRMPKVGKEVDTPEGYGSVFDINVLKETVTVRIHKGDTSELKVFPLEEIKWAKPSQPQPAPEKREDNKGEAKRAKKAKAPKAQPAAEVEAETEIAVETVEEIKPVEQSNDWLRAVEEALNAAQSKQ
jgi:cell fate regulator YaaT (PSP1 superfamily)